jgi:hypothetical protein
MRQAVFAVPSLLLVLSMPANVRAGDDERAIIEKAVKAHGGADKIAKCKAGRVKAEGTFTTPVGDAEYTHDETFELPVKMRREFRMTAMGKTNTLLIVCDGDKTWARRGDGPTEDAGKAGSLDRHPSLTPTTLPGLLEKGVTLSALKEDKVNDRAAVGVKVEVDGKWQRDLYFDKENGLLLKSVKPAVGPAAREPAKIEAVFEEYKEAGGIQVARKITTYNGGKKTDSVRITEVKFLDKVDEGVFAKP